jgi:hypothetical protein
VGLRAGDVVNDDDDDDDDDRDSSVGRAASDLYSGRGRG